MWQAAYGERLSQTRDHVHELSKLLKWFLYQSSTEDRHNLRYEMGEWRQFTDLVRALTSEGAFEGLLRDGTLRAPKKGSMPAAAEEVVMSPDRKAGHEHSSRQSINAARSRRNFASASGFNGVEQLYIDLVE